MKKIPTIFDRNWEGNKTVVDKYVPGISGEILSHSSLVKATEKLDGMNIRLTIRNETVVRIEKRRNPDKIQKHKGITEPWYTDADDASADQHIHEAVAGRDYKDVPDGEWSGEALGPSIQGNPLNLEKKTVVLFSLGEAPVFENVPTTYEELKTWLPAQRSKFGRDCGIEGIVWHLPDGSMCKIKTKDFLPDNR